MIECLLPFIIRINTGHSSCTVDRVTLISPEPGYLYRQTLIPWFSVYFLFCPFSHSSPCLSSSCSPSALDSWQTPLLLLSLQTPLLPIPSPFSINNLFPSPFPPQSTLSTSLPLSFCFYFPFPFLLLQFAISSRWQVATVDLKKERKKR